MFSRLSTFLCMPHVSYVDIYIFMCNIVQRLPFQHSQRFSLAPFERTSNFHVNLIANRADRSKGTCVHLVRDNSVILCLSFRLKDDGLARHCQWPWLKYLEVDSCGNGSEITAN